MYNVGFLDRQQFVEIAVRFWETVANCQLLRHQRLAVANGYDSGRRQSLNPLNMHVSGFSTADDRNS